MRRRRPRLGRRDGASSGTAGQELIPAADVPGDGRIVVTRPEEGDFKAFPAIRTHQGRVVTDVADGTRRPRPPRRPVQEHRRLGGAGPATRPLPEERITVEGDPVHRA